MHDEAIFLEDGDKLPGWDHPLSRMPPAHKRFHTHNLVADLIILWLQVYRKLSGFKGGLHLLDNFLLVKQLCTDLLIIVGHVHVRHTLNGSLRQHCAVDHRADRQPGRVNHVQAKPGRHAHRQRDPLHIIQTFLKRTFQRNAGGCKDKKKICGVMAGDAFITRVKVRAEALGNMIEQRVARFMAKLVVDNLEIFNVDAHNTITARGLLPHQHLRFMNKGSAVIKTGQ